MPASAYQPRNSMVTIVAKFTSGHNMNPLEGLLYSDVIMKNMICHICKVRSCFFLAFVLKEMNLWCRMHWLEKAKVQCFHLTRPVHIKYVIFRYRYGYKYNLLYVIWIDFMIHSCFMSNLSFTSLDQIHISSQPCFQPIAPSPIVMQVSPRYHHPTFSLIQHLIP